MSDRDVKTPEPVKRRWRRFILPVSLALNLLFVGVFVGGGWMRHKYGADFNGPSGFFTKHVLRHLPDEKRQSILDKITDHRNSQIAKKGELRAHYEGFQKALKEEPFDGAHVRVMAKHLQTARGDLADEKMALLINVLTQLSPDERREILQSRFFRRLFKRHNRRHHRRGRRN